MGQEQKGVTLVESCVVLALCTVVLTAAVPSMRRLLDRQALRGSAEELRTDLQFLRSAAVSSGRVMWLAVQGGTGSCYIVYSGGRDDCHCDATGAATCAPGARALKVVNFGADSTVQLRASVSPLGIEPVRGTATPTATLQLIGRAGDTVHEIVNVMGRVRACSPAGAVPGYKAC